MIPDSLFYQSLLIYFILINVTGAVMMMADKYRSVKGQWRIRENKLMVTAFAGAAFGMFLVSVMIRHKTKKPIFRIGLPFAIMCHTVALFLLIL